MFSVQLHTFVGKLWYQKFAEEGEYKLGGRPFRRVDRNQEILQKILEQRSEIRLLAFTPALLEEHGEELNCGGHSVLIPMVDENISIHPSLEIRLWNLVLHLDKGAFKGLIFILIFYFIEN